jgi:hypothetical protein
LQAQCQLTPNLYSEEGCKVLTLVITAPIIEPEIAHGFDCPKLEDEKTLNK